MDIEYVLKKVPSEHRQMFQEAVNKLLGEEWDDESLIEMEVAGKNDQLLNTSIVYNTTHTMRNVISALDDHFGILVLIIQFI